LTKQSTSAFEGSLELLLRVGGRDRGRLRLDGAGHALREDAIKIRTPDADPTADRTAGSDP
jgi:hypothetical protein